MKIQITFGLHFLNIFTNGISVVCVGTVVGIGALSVLLIATVEVYTKAQDVHTSNMGLE